MRRPNSALAPLLVVLGLLLTVACAKKLKPGDPLQGLGREEQDEFERGRTEFNRVFTPRTGLGPLFNADSCAECHEDPVPGGAGDEVEVHATAFRTDGPFCDPLVEKGGFVIQQRVTPELKAALGIDSEPVPSDAMGTARRTSPDVFGFGLLDAVPDATLLALADPDDRNHDGISGRPNRFVDGRIGRFGRKALVPTLREFVDGAFVAEQGITNPSIPTEETIGGTPIPEGVDLAPDPEIDRRSLSATNAYMRFLAPPAPQDIRGGGKRGRRVFARIRCDGCHIPTLKTGDSSAGALRFKRVTAYTDLLLHDMGEGLSDGCLGTASPSEFRTEPLMGLRFSQSFLHDGRAKSIEEAIRQHGGEGAASRDAFASLYEDDRRALLEFLKSL